MFFHGFRMVRVRRINNGFIGLNGFWVRRINNGFIGLNGFLGASSRGCTCLRSALPLARARSAPTEHMNVVCFVGAAETAAPT